MSTTDNDLAPATDALTGEAAQAWAELVPAPWLRDRLERDNDQHPATAGDLAELDHLAAEVDPAGYVAVPLAGPYIEGEIELEYIPPAGPAGPAGEG